MFFSIEQRLAHVHLVNLFISTEEMLKVDLPRLVSAGEVSREMVERLKSLIVSATSLSNVWTRQLQIEVHETKQLFIDMVNRKENLGCLLCGHVAHPHIGDVHCRIQEQPSLLESGPLPQWQEAACVILVVAECPREGRLLRREITRFAVHDFGFTLLGRAGVIISAVGATTATVKHRVHGPRVLR